MSAPITPSPSTELIVPGEIHAETEFQGDKTGLCGPTALAMTEAWATQSLTNHHTLDVFARMHAAGRADPNGASTIEGIHLQAQADGFTVDYLPYGEPMAVDTWRAFLMSHMGRTVVVIEVANGQAFRDLLTGDGENARNLHYHFVMVAGYHAGGASPRAGGRDLPPGWWVADGDNFVNSGLVNGQGRLVFYTDAVLAAARPCGAVAVYPKVRITPVAPVQPAPGAIGGSPAMFQVQPNGDVFFPHTNVTIPAGFATADWITANHPTGDALLPVSYPVDSTQGVTPFSDGLVLVFDKGDGQVHTNRAGQIVATLVRQKEGLSAAMASANAEIAALAAKATEDATTITQLHTEIGDLEQQVAQAKTDAKSAAPAVDPTASKALAAVQALKGARDQLDAVFGEL